MAGRLQDKVMLVTGAGSGLGREVVLLAAEEGAKVVVTDKIEGRIGPVVEAITSKGGQAAGLKADVTSEAEVEAAVAFAVDTFGVLNVAHANAGVTVPGQGSVPLEDTTLESWRVPHDQARGPGNEADGRRIDRTNAVCPTHGVPVNFGLPPDAPVAGLSYEEAAGPWDKSVTVMPLRIDRPPTLSDNAWPVIFLASDESAYMSGVFFPTADGGQHARTSIPFPDNWGLDQQTAG